ncbi:MAG: Ig-like domain-containing protein, partial [bacterium]|nr:Ig-like domain-containing protein [bacterium]
MELSLGGAILLKPAVISFGLTQEELNSLSAEDQLYIVKLEKIDYSLGWVLNSICNLTGGRIGNFDEANANGLPFPGVSKGGTYLFLKALAPVGYIKGNVTLEGVQTNDALISLNPETSTSSHLIKSFSGVQGAVFQKSPLVVEDTYIQLAFTGTIGLTAKNLSTNDTGTGAVEIDNKGVIVTLDINITKSGPQILGVTPADNAEGVPLNSTISFVFSKTIKASTFNSQTVLVSGGTGTVAGTLRLSADGKQGESKPGAEFPSGTEIGATVTTDLKDITGNPMRMSYTARFHTLDTEAPEADLDKIQLHIPENGISNITGAAGSV